MQSQNKPTNVNVSIGICESGKISYTAVIRGEKFKIMYFVWKMSCYFIRLKEKFVIEALS